jgi:hypothetical protein
LFAAALNSLSRTHTHTLLFEKSPSKSKLTRKRKKKNRALLPLFDSSNWRSTIKKPLSVKSSPRTGESWELEGLKKKTTGGRRG